MGYLIRVDSLPIFVRSEQQDRDFFTANCPLSLDRPTAAFPHLCFVFSRVNGHFGGEFRLSHVGVVFGRGDRNSDFTRKLEVTNVRALREPISVPELRRELRKQHDDAVREGVEQGSGIFTEAADNAIVAAVAKLRPTFAETLHELRNLRRETMRSAGADRWELGLDATRIALRIGDFSSAPLRSWQAPAEPTHPVLAGIKRQPTEKDLIAHDSRVLPGWTPQVSQDVHVRVFSAGERHMEITDINADPQEGVLGVDLVYYHREARSCILVQYKRLDEDSKEIRVDKRLDQQLDRMERLSQLNLAPQRHDDWRLGRDYCYLKLCHTRTESGVVDPTNVELLPGLYLPLSYVRLALLDERVRGPNRGRYLGYDRVERHITNTLFLELAKEGWIGSCGMTSEELMEIANGSLTAGHELLLAIDYSPETPKQRIQRQRSRGRTSRRRRQATPTDQEVLF